MDLESDLKVLLMGNLDKKEKDEEFRKGDLDSMAARKLFNGDENSGLIEFNAGDKKPHVKKIVEDSNEVTKKNFGKQKSLNYENRCIKNIGKERSDVEGGEDGDVDMKSSEADEDSTGWKRKRESYLGILTWINKVAKDPCDPTIGSLPESHKWKCYGIEQLWKQVFFVRETIILKRNVDSSAQQSVWQKKQNMHPSIYEDDSGSERPRYSQRLVSARDFVKARKRIRSESSSPDSQGDKQSKSLADHVALWVNSHNQKRIPVGPLFQANLPEYTGKSDESDSKWLGTQIWPLAKGECHGNLIERDRIGKGRQDSCGCQFPRSVECVRFHVSEKRTRVKLELCSAFYRWKFDSMGEEVALCWPKEDQNKFQDIVKSNPLSLDKCFWDELFQLFPSKGREALVSYYFNVFLLRSRGDQNRMATSNIDSDDEVLESGPITNRFGQLAAKSPGSIFCSPKKSHLNAR